MFFNGKAREREIHAPSKDNVTANVRMPLAPENPGGFANREGSLFFGGEIQRVSRQRTQIGDSLALKTPESVLFAAGARQVQQLSIEEGYLKSAVNLRRQTKGSKIGSKKRTKWDSRDGPNRHHTLQLVDVVYPCREGWEGPELASSPPYAC